MEIIPPSFTGDPNHARCDEMNFRFLFTAFNAVTVYERFGFQKNFFQTGRKQTGRCVGRRAAATNPHPPSSPLSREYKFIPQASSRFWFSPSPLPPSIPL
jgi:hypothetical protein